MTADSNIQAHNRWVAGIKTSILQPNYWVMGKENEIKFYGLERKTSFTQKWEKFLLIPTGSFFSLDIDK